MCSINVVALYSISIDSALYMIALWIRENIERYHICPMGRTPINLSKD